MSAWARPGVKCVCVDDGPCRNSGLQTGLRKGDVYTIRKTLGADLDGFDGVTLVEIEAPFEWNGLGFTSNRFRPLTPISQEQDVAKFRHLLVPSPIDAGLVPAGVELDA